MPHITFNKGRGSMNKKFTLIELLVVVAIIGILVSILLPSLEKARRSTKIAACLNNEKSLYLGFFLFSDDNDGRYPPAESFDGQLSYNGSWDRNIDPYLGDQMVEGEITDDDGDYHIYQCPLDTKRTHTGALGDNYAINSYATNSLWSFFTPQDTTPLNTDFGINSTFIGRNISEIKSDTIILMEGMQSRVGYSWWSALETHNNQNMLDVQNFYQHKNAKMNFLFNDGSAAAKKNMIFYPTSEYLKIN